MGRDRNKHQKPKINVKEEGRGLLKMVIDPSVFSKLTPGQTFQVTSSPIPKGSIIIGAGYDHSRHSFILVLQHDDFEKVTPGDLIPVAGAIDFKPVVETTDQEEK